jgi:hypothetical protein
MRITLLEINDGNRPRIHNILSCPNNLNDPDTPSTVLNFTFKPRYISLINALTAACLQTRKLRVEGVP